MENENKNIIVGEDGSYFDGGYWAYIGRNLLVGLVTVVTFGIAHPWIRCWYQRWLCEHTVINGKRMTFDAKGGELFVKYIIWLLLSYVTCGIYGLWMRVALKKWFTERTNFEGEPDNNSFFDGRVGDYFVTSILSALAAFVPFVGLAWSKIIMTRWFVKHTVIDSRRLTFRGTIGDLFLKYLLWGLLSSVTCGIFAWFVPVKYIKWETEHTFDEDGTPEALKEKANYKTQIHTDAVMLKSGDSAQIQSIKAEMINDANAGIGEESLEKLNNALRFADILKEYGEEFSAEENELIYNCEILSRKLKAAKPVASNSKVGVIIVAIIAAFVMLIGVLGGLAAAAMFMQRTSFEGPAMQGAVENGEISYDAFYRNLEKVASRNGCTLTEVTSGVNERVYSMSDGIPNSYVEIYIADNGVSVTEIGIYGSRKRGDLDNEYIVKNAVKYVYYALCLGDVYDISPDVSVDSSKNYGVWSFDTDSEPTDISVEITK